MDDRDEPGWVLLAGRQADNATLRDAVEAVGYGWRVMPPGPVDDELLAGAVGAVVPAARPLTADEVGRAPRLRAVVSPVIGTDQLPLQTLAERGIPVAHGAFPENYVGMAEAAVGLVVALVHRIKEKEAALVAGTRPPGVGGLVSGRTIGLVGLGRIGSAIAERLGSWGCRMVSTSSAAGRTPGVEPVTMSELLALSDVISVQVPLTPATCGLIGAEAIRAMRPGAALISIGRGGVVDERALAEALDDGRLSGAAIDVWEEEPPPPDHPLLHRPDVIATMHNVGHSEESYRRMAELSGEQLLDLLAGRQPAYPLPTP
ncbi:D-3-phosphoglycerate dehydrogenase [Actinomycetales bacterium JB111]|nr:D-3-phosphoglycerate dehydrogenase [Actinomycetales bacterium JB111]